MPEPTFPMPRSQAYDANTRIKERPLAFVDLEFSGLGADHEILQIAAVMVNQPGFEITGQWESRVRPEQIGNADPVALAMVGYSEEAWKDAMPLRDALERFDSLVSGAVLAGFNVVGDFYQLKKSYHAAGLTPTFHWQVLDVQSMLFATHYGSGLRGFRMKEVVPYFKLTERTWHDALADALATYDVFRAVMNATDHGR